MRRESRMPEWSWEQEMLKVRLAEAPECEKYLVAWEGCKLGLERVREQVQVSEQAPGRALTFDKLSN
jgi:hypothetical protein